jgi:hypothetical protein
MFSYTTYIHIYLYNNYYTLIISYKRQLYDDNDDDIIQ